MATGTGKTRTAAAFVKRLFEAGIVTRVLFLVDRIALAGQAEDAFNDHLRDYPCHVLRPGRGFDRTKRITIATLQTMITEYRGLSSGFDLVLTDECHRSIYGKWSGVLRHFDGIQLGARQPRRQARCPLRGLARQPAVRRGAGALGGLDRQSRPDRRDAHGHVPRLRLRRAPFRGLGGYEQARRVFGGQSALDRLIAGFNAAVFGQAGATDPLSGDEQAAP